jgi:hypothetical protein
LYVDLLPLLNSKRVDLLHHGKLALQLCSLERRTSRGGKDSIDHGQGANSHDDLANCLAGIASMCVQQGVYDWRYDWVTGPDRPEADRYAEVAERVQFQCERFGAFLHLHGMPLWE